VRLKSNATLQNQQTLSQYTIDHGRDRKYSSNLEEGSETHKGELANLKKANLTRS
jgi:hypothetical protein